jgi:hypothetical protein
LHFSPFSNLYSTTPVALFSLTVLLGQAKLSFIERYVIAYVRMAASFSAWRRQALLRCCFQAVELLTPLFQSRSTVFVRTPFAASTKIPSKPSCYVGFAS